MEERRARILLVDDHPENLLALEAVLEPLGHELVRAGSGEEALKRLLEDEFALILLDVQMPGLDGFATAEYVKRRERTRHIPIIFLTALSKDADQVFRGYAAGAVDYVLKPFDPVVLRSKVSVFLELHLKGRALADSERRFRAAFDHAPIGVALIDPDGRWEQVNRSLCRLLGRAEDELLGRAVEDAVHHRDRRAEAEDRRRLLAGQADSVQGERQLVRGDGVPVPALVSVSLVRDGDGRPRHFVTQVEDVTERKRAERERIERLEERARRAEAEAAAETMRKLQIVSDAALSHLRLDELSDEILTCLGRVMTVDTAAVLLLDPDGERLVVTASKGLEEDVEAGASLPVGEGFAGRVAAERRPLAVPDVHETPLAGPLLGPKGLRSVLGVPLLLKDRLLGVLRVGTLEAREFTEEEVGLLRLVAERAALAIEHARLYERERGFVETLQRSLLPERLPRLPGLTLAARYLPGGDGAKVGGDWYDAVALDDGRVALAMGDVVGHGLEAAALMGQLRNALRAYAVDGDSPAAAVARLDRLVHTLEQGRMATLLYLLVEPDGARLRFASAGHLPPLVRDPDGATRFLEGGRSLPLGVDPEAGREEATVELAAGSTLLLYTDGLVEDRASSIGAGLSALERAVDDGPVEPDDLCRHVVERLLSGRAVRDDVAVLGLRTAPLPSERLTLELSTDPRALSSMRRTLGRWLRAAGASHEEGREIEFACHEACSNAIEHGFRFGPGSFDVEALLEGRQVSITVRDSGRWREPRPSERGRGIGLMEALMDRVEVSPDGGGTVVRMRRELGRRNGRAA